MRCLQYAASQAVANDIAHVDNTLRVKLNQTEQLRVSWKLCTICCLPPGRTVFAPHPSRNRCRLTLPSPLTSPSLPPVSRSFYPHNPHSLCGPALHAVPPRHAGYVLSPHPYPRFRFSHRAAVWSPPRALQAMLETCLGEVVSEIAELLSTKKRLEERSGKVQAKMGVNSSRLQVRQEWGCARGTARNNERIHGIDKGCFAVHCGGRQQQQAAGAGTRRQREGGEAGVHWMGVNSSRLQVRGRGGRGKRVKLGCTGWAPTAAGCRCGRKCVHGISQ